MSDASRADGGTPRTGMLVEVAGWYGMAAILAAYALTALEALAPTDPVCQLLNLTGALGVAWVCWRKRTWQAFWLEAIWATIAAIALLRSLA